MNIRILTSNSVVAGFNGTVNGGLHDVYCKICDVSLVLTAWTTQEKIPQWLISLIEMR